MKGMGAECAHCRLARNSWGIFILLLCGDVEKGDCFPRCAGFCNIPNLESNCSCNPLKTSAFNSGSLASCLHYRERLVNSIIVTAPPDLEEQREDLDMKRVVLVLALALVIPALAMATDFTYYTTGTFGDGATCNTNVCTVGTATLTFTGVGSLSTPAGPFSPGSDVTMGMFGNTVTGSGNNFSGIAFTLNLFQVMPGSGTGVFAGSLQGTISQTLSTGTWVLTSSSDLVAQITAPAGVTTIYTLDTTRGPGACSGVPNCIVLGGPNQSSTVTAFVTQVPEPASIMLFGSGLTGLAGLVRRRFKK
jgi:hypothetical protein